MQPKDSLVGNFFAPWLDRVCELLKCEGRWRCSGTLLLVPCNDVVDRLIFSVCYGVYDQEHVVLNPGYG